MSEEIDKEVKGNNISELLVRRLTRILESFQESLDEVDYVRSSEPSLHKNLNNFIQNQEEERELPFLLEENHTKLGIPQWTLPLIFTFLKEWLLTNRSHISQYHFELDYYSRSILLVNPSWYPAYAIRKQLIIDGFLKPYTEKSFLDLLFTLKPCSKVSACWYHRKWITSFQNKTDPSSMNRDNLLNELKIGFSFVGRIPRNYIGWEFLSWNLSFYERKGVEWLPQLLQDQLDCIVQFLRTHPTESGAFYYIAHIMKLYTSESHLKTYLPSIILKTIQEIHQIAESYPTRSQSTIYGLINLFGHLKQNLGRSNEEVDTWNSLFSQEQLWLETFKLTINNTLETPKATIEAYGQFLSKIS